MNFLSHFYFDRHTRDPNQVLGSVLPDLVKNARKDWNLRPEKKQELFTGVSENAILKGWKRHLIVDRHFHNSSFFFLHTAAIRMEVAPILINSHVRPSFLAHITLELMLDRLLLTEGVVNPDELYSKLRESDRTALQNFLVISRLTDPAFFLNFFDGFMKSAYLNNYRDTSQMVYALNRICMRVWPESMTEAELLQLGRIILGYYQKLKECYMEIFEEIGAEIDQ